MVEPCIAPTGLTAANTTDNSSDLSWDAQGSNTFEYVVDESATAPIVAGTPTAGTSFNATTLDPLTTYYLHVRTDCGSGNFSPWETISFTTQSDLGILEQESIYLTAFPNPTNGLVTISGATNGIVILNNLNGQELMKIDLQEILTLDLSTFERGMYFLVYSSKGKNTMIKLIKN